jgi:hypothetical protein
LQVRNEFVVAVVELLDISTVFGICVSDLMVVQLLNILQLLSVLLDEFGSVGVKVLFEELSV